MKFHHLGIPTREPRDGETCPAEYGFHCTDHARNPFGIQWMRFDSDCTLPELVQTASRGLVGAVLGATVYKAIGGKGD